MAWATKSKNFLNGQQKTIVSYHRALKLIVENTDPMISKTAVLSAGLTLFSHAISDRTFIGRGDGSC